MSGFCDRAWQQTTALRAAIHDLPFNRELAAGVLDEARFQFYIQQDSLYLDQYARILAIAGARGPDGQTLHLFAQSALEAVAVEQALHGQYLSKFAATAATQPSPDCLSYTSFLLATAYHESWEVLLAALLPCFWIYWDVGNSISRQAASSNKYRAWIDTYADDGFAHAVRLVKTATDAAAEATTVATQARMMTAFLRSTQYEYLFWDGAYKLRQWPANN